MPPEDVELTPELSKRLWPPWGPIPPWDPIPDWFQLARAPAPRPVAAGGRGRDGRPLPHRRRPHLPLSG
jgi:hypothetical protein